MCLHLWILSSGILISDLSFYGGINTGKKTDILELHLHKQNWCNAKYQQFLFALWANNCDKLSARLSFLGLQDTPNWYDCNHIAFISDSSILFWLSTVIHFQPIVIYDQYKLSTKYKYDISVSHTNPPLCVRVF